MSVLMAMRSADSRLRGHILTRQTAVSAFGWTLTPHDSADAERAERASRRLRTVIPEIIRHQVQAVLYDAFALELGWGVGVDGITPVALRRHEPVELEKVSDYAINIVGDNPSRMDRLMPLSPQEPKEQFIIDISDDDMTATSCARRLDAKY